MNRMRTPFLYVFAALFLCTTTACQSPGSAALPTGPAGTPVPTTTPGPAGTPVPTTTPGPAGTPVPTTPPRTYKTGALIYNGTGTSQSDTDSIVAILNSHQTTYRVVTSAQLNAMTAAELLDFGTIIWPGGAAKTMSDSLTSAAEQRVRDAVVAGVGYVGFCAGAFIAGDYGSWGLKLAAIDFPYYYLENQGVVKAMVLVTFTSGSKRDLIWYGGPELADFGQVIAKNPDGTTAIAQQKLGKGLVLLSGPHPEAPSGWRSGLTDSDGLDFDIAWNMIHAAMTTTLM